MILLRALSIGTPHEAEGHARRAYERRKPGGGKVPRRAKVLRRQKERRELLAQGGKPEGQTVRGWKGI